MPSATVTGLVNGRRYVFGVAARNAAGGQSAFTLSNEVAPGPTLSLVVEGGGVSQRFSAPLPPISPKVTPSSAGLLPGVALTTHTGDLTITSAGVSVSNLHVTGDVQITVRASDVTLTNVLVDGAVLLNNDAEGGAIQNVTLTHVDARGLFTTGFKNLVVDSCAIHGTVNNTISQLASYGSANPATGLVIKGSRFYGLAKNINAGTHLEALHLLGVQGFAFTDSVFDATAPDQATWNHITGALVLDEQFQGVSSSGTVTGCTFLGGGYYQLYGYGITALDNCAFVTAISPDGSEGSVPMYPTSNYRSFPKFEQHGNTLDGKPYTVPL